MVDIPWVDAENNKYRRAGYGWFLFIYSDWTSCRLECAGEEINGNLAHEQHEIHYNQILMVGCHGHHNFMKY